MKNLTLPVRIPAPEGTFRAAVADVSTSEMVQTKFGLRDEIRLTWEIEPTNPTTGKRLSVCRTFTASLHVKSAFRPFIESMVGRALDDAKLREHGFDPEVLLGRSCMVKLVHQTGKDGNIYCNVTNAYPLPVGIEPLTVKDYARKVA